MLHPTAATKCYKTASYKITTHNRLMFCISQHIAHISIYLGQNTSSATYIQYQMSLQWCCNLWWWWCSFLPSIPPWQHGSISNERYPEIVQGVQGLEFSAFIPPGVRQLSEFLRFLLVDCGLCTGALCFLAVCPSTDEAWPGIIHKWWAVQLPYK